MDKILTEMHGHLDELCMLANEENTEIINKILEGFTKLARLNESVKQNENALK